MGLSLPSRIGMLNETIIEFFSTWIYLLYTLNLIIRETKFVQTLCELCAMR